MDETQRLVFESVAARGYVDGYLLSELIERQLIKAVEELGEVARCVFDGREPPVEELADVAIPLFVMASVMRVDLLRAVREKVQNDVMRGVR
jgi:NTP pyrophosphatase (non-canonical NTP hydrolase)